MKRNALICLCLAAALLLSGCCVCLPLDKITERPKQEMSTAPATVPATQAPTEAITEAATEPTEPPTTEPPTTEPPTTAPTEPVQTETQVELTADIQRRINLFLSNFAEQGFKRYPAGDYEMLQFGYMYCKINRNEKLGSTSSTYYVKKADMDTFLMDFFGKTAKGQDYEGIGPYDGITFENNAYHFQAADGGFFGYFAVASEMVKNSDGTYNVTFDIYEIDYEDELRSSHYDMTAFEASTAQKLTRSGSGSAIVRDYTRSTGKVSYQLIRYELD